MVMMVPPPAVAKTRLPAGFLTTLALLYNQCLPLLAPGRCTATTHMRTDVLALTDINKKASLCALTDPRTCMVHAHTATLRLSRSSLHMSTPGAQPEPTHASSYK